MGMNGAWLFLIAAPVLGGLLAGADRIVTARMQSRYGPPVVQPFYDVLKLLQKTNLLVNRYHGYYLFCFLILTIVAGGFFFAGADLLLAIFALTVGEVMLVLAAYSAYSPYSLIGAERELIQMLAVEPMLLLSGVGLGTACGTFDVAGIVACPRAPILALPGIFLGLVFVLTVKLRKSPFDLSTSHHAHQELVKGLTTEFAGPSLALVEIAHWYETVFLLGLVWLFFAPWPVLGAIVTLLVYGLEILIDNVHARFKWGLTLKGAWWATMILGLGNLLVLHLVRTGGL